MKTPIKFLAGLVTTIGLTMAAATVNAQQWNGENTTTGEIYRTGNIGIGVSNPDYVLDISGRPRIRSKGSTAGIWFNNSDNSDIRGFVGMDSDTYIGLYGRGGAGWAFRMNVVNGYIGLGIGPQTKLHLNLNGTAASEFDGIRIHYDESSSVVRADIGYFGGKGSFGINAYGSSYADISFKTNGTTRMFIESNGNVGIGTTSTSDAKLSVNGLVKAEEIVVANVGADYVFDENYQLLTLEEVEQFINENKHLPDIAPASETEKGIKVGEFNELLLQKIEELTLYMIEMNKKVESLEKENTDLKEQINSMTK